MGQSDRVDWFAVESGVALTLVEASARQTFSYVDLAADAEQTACRLMDANIKSGTSVGVGISHSVAAIRLIYGVLWHGSVLLPFDPLMHLPQRDRLLQLADCHVLIMDEILPERPISTQELSYTQLLNRDERCLGCALPPSTESDLGLVVATSGSTGDPKGVILTSKNLWSSASASNSRLGLSFRDRWLNALPLRHIGGLSIIYRCLQAGAEMVLMNAFDPDLVWHEICEEKITHISLVPTMLYRLLKVSAGQAPPACLRVVLVGGGALSNELASRARHLGWPLCITYGMSEAASQVACDCSSKGGHQAGYVGQPLDGFSVRVEPDGCLAVKGPAVMAGYLNSAKETGLGLDEGWFKTGDLGRLDDQGAVHVLGRADSVLISGGVNVYPALVEQQLMACPGVMQVAVTGVPDVEWGSALVAIYVGGCNADVVKDWARINLSGAESPKQFIKVDELPCDAMGKVARDKLQALI